MFDEKANGAREEAMAKRLLADGGVSVIVLGGAHDLADNLERLSDGKVEYVQVTPKGWAQLNQINWRGTKLRRQQSSMILVTKL